MPGWLAQFFLLVVFSNDFVECAIIDAIGGDDAKPLRPKVCETAACNKIAYEILEKMDRRANPCDDFNEFACGNYSKNEAIPRDQSRLNLFAQLRRKVERELKTIVESDITDGDARSFRILKSYYDTCMNEEQIEKNGEKELLDVLKKLGGWPILEGKTWKEASFDWKRMLKKFHETGFSYNFFVSLSIQPNRMNVTQKMLLIDQASLGLSQEYLSKGVEHKIVRAYFKYMVDLAEILGANRTQAEKELKESLDFEIELAKISLSTRKKRGTLPRHMTIIELQTNYSFVPWVEYLNGYTHPYAKLKLTELVGVKVPSFLESLGKLTDKTSNRVLANYAYWRIVKKSVDGLPERAKSAQRKYSAHLSGNKHKIPRWQECIDHVKDRLYLSAGALYVRKHFNKQAKSDAIEIISNLKNAFRHMLVDVDWMKKATKKQALEKLDNILPFVGYSDELLDDKALDDYYKNLKLHPNSFLRTTLSLNVFAKQQSLKNFRKPALRSDWTDYFSAAATVNAFYNSLTNTIKIPAGILQGAFFNADHPKYLNYGAIGAVVGHEMTHGFDDKGRKFDKNGNLVDWWDPKTEKAYLKKTDCIVKQYSNFTVEELNLNVDGNLTQGENIADNGGLKEAYKAYEAWQKENGDEPRLPGFESFTPKQMFWISYANIWCSKYRSQQLSNILITNVHAPSFFRITGPISNMAEFANDFSCPVGSIMNPVDKCSVW